MRWLQPASNKRNDTEMHSVVLKVPVLLCEEVTDRRDQAVAVKTEVTYRYSHAAGGEQDGCSDNNFILIF